MKATLGQALKILGFLTGVPGERVQELIESGLLPDLLSADISSVSRPAFRNACGLPAFPVWKTLDLNLRSLGIRNGDDLVRALSCSNMPAEGILSSFSFFSVGRPVRLVRVSLEDLGLRAGASLGVIYDQARRIGLDLCPTEVGPCLKLHHEDQLRGQALIIGMLPVYDDRQRPRIFMLTADGWLEVLDGNNRSFFAYSKIRWIFVLPDPA